MTLGYDLSMDFRGTKGKIIILSLVGALIVTGGGLAFGLNLRVVQAKKIAFAEGCDKLRFSINEDFATYQKESVWPLSYLAAYDSGYNPFYNPKDTVMNIKADINKYRLLAIQNQKYDGAKKSSTILDKLRESFDSAERFREKKESKERANPNANKIYIKMSMANKAQYNPFGGFERILPLSQIELLEFEANTLYFEHMRIAWSTEDQAQLDDADSEFKSAWRNLSDLCSKARA